MQLDVDRSREEGSDQLRAATWLVVALAPFILLVLSLTAYGEFKRGRELRSEVIAAYDTQVQIQRVFSLLQDAETGQRGYVITGQPRFLDPWRHAEDQLPGQLKTLDRQFTGDANQQRLLSQLHRLVELKRKQNAAGIRLRQERGPGPAMELVAGGRGKALMDALRSTVNQMNRRESEALQARLNDADRNANRTALIGALLVASLAVMLLAAVLLLGQTLRLRQAVTQAARERAENLSREIEERRAVEAALEQALVQAEAASVAQAEFMANMSHELRTPLTSMMGYAGLLQSAAGLAEEERRFVTRIRSAGQVLLTTVNDVLDYSRLEAGSLELSYERIGLDSFLADNAAMIAPQAQAKRLALQIVPPPSGSWIECDVTRLRQVLLNLLNNAVKFTERGMVGLSCAADEDHVRFEVTDTGPGIPEDKLGRLFKRFSQVDGSIVRDHGGSGLGLAICKALVDAMQGRIGVTTAEGAGSTFWFELPRRAPVAGAPDVAAQAA